MIKAGLVGWVRFLPLGDLAMPGWSGVAIGLGLATAFGGVLLGLTQRDAKVVLAYSSVSQMGFVTVLVGVAFGVPSAAPLAVAAASVYAMHHGPAKAVLFLGVGLLRRRTGKARRLLLGGIGFAALSLTGLPATSGAFAKTWAKQAVDAAPGGGGIGLALSLAAVGTALLMARLVVVLPPPGAVAGASPGQGGIHLVPWTALLATVAVMTVAVPTRVLAELDAPATTLAAARETIWPVAVGALLAYAATVVGRKRPLPVPSVPPGDLVVVGERAVVSLGHALRAAGDRVAPELLRRNERLRALLAGLGRRDEGLDRVEGWLTRWRTGGVLVALVAAAVVQALRWDVS